jgi:hypothetical protein
MVSIGRSIHPIRRSGLCLPQRLHEAIVAQVFGFDKSWLSTYVYYPVYSALGRRVPKAAALSLLRRLHPGADSRRRLAQPAIGQLFVLDSGNSQALCLSIRSSKGLEMRFWQRLTIDGEQVHSLTGSPW